MIEPDERTAVAHMPNQVREPADDNRGLMAGLAIRESVMLAGLAERARVARTFVSGVLRPGTRARMMLPSL